MFGKSVRYNGDGANFSGFAVKASNRVKPEIDGALASIGYGNVTKPVASAAPKPVGVNKITRAEKELSDLIVENPHEVIVEFPLPSVNIEDKSLPFFKTLMLKVAAI